MRPPGWLVTISAGRGVCRALEMDGGNKLGGWKTVLTITSILAMCFVVMAVLAYGGAPANAAPLSPPVGVPSTSTLDASAPLLLGGLLLILSGALIVGSRRSVPTER